MDSKEGAPIRSHMDDPKIKWKFTKPEYSLVDKMYMEGRTRVHKAGSLEQIVSDLVKTWEMESTHKVDQADWGTIDHDNFIIVCNGGRELDIDDNIRMGNYNMFMEESPLWPKDISNDDAFKLFKTAFPDGFAWELLDILSGPPRVSFTWRHWTNWTGPYGDVKPTGERIEMTGVALVTVNDALKVQKLDVVFDPNPAMMKFMDAKSKQGLMTTGACPFANLHNK